MFNRAIGVLPILFSIILFLFGCQQSDRFNIEQITAIELDTGWDVVEIDDKNDISNVIKTMSTMKTEKTKDSEANTKYFFITDSGKVSFDITEDCITVENTAYKGFEECQAIHDIFNDYISRNNSFVEAIKKSSTIRLIAGDMNESIDITGDKEKLMTIFSNADINVNDNPGYAASNYPDYSIEYVINNEIGQISVIDGKNLVLRAYNAGFTRFISNEDVWNYCSRNIPQKELKDTGDLCYLFLASRMIVEHEVYRGEYPNKMNWVIRSLRESELVSEDEISATKSEMTLHFNINDREYKVEVFQDGFVYMGKFYTKINIFNEITSILNAG